MVDYDPRVQQWSSIEQLLFDKRVTAPIVLVLADSDGVEATEAVARIAHRVALNSMEIHEIITTIRDACTLEGLVSHQFEVLRCNRLYQSLTQRQRDIVDFVVEGAPNKQIATKLNVSVKTIERERKRAYDQLHVRSTAEMTRVVILAGLQDVIFPAKATPPIHSVQRVDRQDSPSNPPSIPTMETSVKEVQPRQEAYSPQSYS
jgi:DNA-binding NarL/FixJ family response regulator